ncbi:hypothetical protein BF283_000085 [Escherichia coli]|nr:hypothetical protein [Escherichia coli]
MNNIKEWDGVGLPQVGTKCEITINAGNVGSCEVLFVGDSLLVWRQELSGQEGSGYHRHMKFGHIRSEEEKKRDVAISAIDAACLLVRDASKTAEAIYDAIAAGDIPGVKIE